MARVQATVTVLGSSVEFLGEIRTVDSTALSFMETAVRLGHWRTQHLEHRFNQLHQPSLTHSFSCIFDADPGAKIGWARWITSLMQLG